MDEKVYEETIFPIYIDDSDYPPSHLEKTDLINRPHQTVRYSLNEFQSNSLIHTNKIALDIT